MNSHKWVGCLKCLGENPKRWEIDLLENCSSERGFDILAQR